MIWITMEIDCRNQQDPKPPLDAYLNTSSYLGLSNRNRQSFAFLFAKAPRSVWAKSGPEFIIPLMESWLIYKIEFGASTTVRTHSMRRGWEINENLHLSHASLFNFFPCLSMPVRFSFQMCFKHFKPAIAGCLSFCPQVWSGADQLGFTFAACEEQFMWFAHLWWHGICAASRSQLSWAWKAPGHCYPTSAGSQHVSSLYCEGMSLLWIEADEDPSWCIYRICADCCCCQATHHRWCCLHLCICTHFPSWSHWSCWRPWTFSQVQRDRLACWQLPWRNSLVILGLAELNSRTSTLGLRSWWRNLHQCGHSQVWQCL